MGQRGPEMEHGQRVKMSSSSSSGLLRLDLEILSKPYSQIKLNSRCHSSSWDHLYVRTKGRTQKSKTIPEEISCLFCPPIFHKAIQVSCIYPV